jgi:hypothetical protein
MEDYLNIIEMEDNLNVFTNGRWPPFFLMEDDLNLFENKSQTQFFFKWKKTWILW